MNWAGLVRRRLLWCAFSAVIVTSLPGAGPAHGQSPVAAMPLTAEVTTSVACTSGGGQTQDQTNAAAIFFGYRGDTLFAVTASHVVRPDPACVVREIRVVSAQPFTYSRATVADSDASHDVAVLRIVPDPTRGLIQSLRWIRGAPLPLSSVYLIGCPSGGECWEAPLEVRIRTRLTIRDSVTFTVQSPLIEDGYSGGPAVSGGGEIVGMTLDYSGQNARILMWTWLKAWLLDGGYPVNLPPRSVDALGRKLLVVEIAATPIAARNANGQRLFPSARLRYEEWGAEAAGSWLSAEHLSLPLDNQCATCPDNRQLVGVAGFFGGFGFAAAWRNRGGRVALLPGPITPSASGGLLLGWTEQLVVRNRPDSTDARSGLPAREYFATERSTTLALELAGTVDVAAGPRAGVRMTTRYIRFLNLYSSFGRIGVGKTMLSVAGTLRFP